MQTVCGCMPTCGRFRSKIFPTSLACFPPFFPTFSSFHNSKTHACSHCNYKVTHQQLSCRRFVSDIYIFYIAGWAVQQRRVHYSTAEYSIVQEIRGPIAKYQWKIQQQNPILPANSAVKFLQIPVFLSGKCNREKKPSPSFKVTRNCRKNRPKIQEKNYIHRYTLHIYFQPTIILTT